MGAIKINGSTSGSTTITAPATGGDESIELSTVLDSKLDVAGGKILQVVRGTVQTTNRTTTSTSFVDVTDFNVTISPTKATSAVIVLATQVLAVSGNYVAYSAVTDSSNNIVSGASGALYASNSGAQYVSLIGYSTPATTSATTYKLRFRGNGGTVTIENANYNGVMYAIEVSA